MPCPKCNYDDVTGTDRFCSRRGQLLEPATRLDIRQDVKKNLGWVIGVQTDAIHGNVYGGDIYEYQAHPLAGVATVIRKVVERAQTEAKPS